MNGFNDYYGEKLLPPPYPPAWSDLEPAIIAAPMAIKDKDIPNPSDTVILGEKKTGAFDFYMDIYENGGNDTTGIAEQTRHDSRGDDTSTGGSNYSMADGSARYIKVPAGLQPAQPLRAS